MLQSIWIHNSNVVSLMQNDVCFRIELFFHQPRKILDNPQLFEYTSNIEELQQNNWIHLNFNFLKLLSFWSLIVSAFSESWTILLLLRLYSKCKSVEESLDKFNKNSRSINNSKQLETHTCFLYFALIFELIGLVEELINQLFLKKLKNIATFSSLSMIRSVSQGISTVLCQLILLSKSENISCCSILATFDTASVQWIKPCKCHVFTVPIHNGAVRFMPFGVLITTDQKRIIELERIYFCIKVDNIRTLAAIKCGQR